VDTLREAVVVVDSAIKRDCATRTRTRNRGSLNVRFAPNATDAASPRNDVMGHKETYDRYPF
jgi:hypothetical protein